MAEYCFVKEIAHKGHRYPEERSGAAETHRGFLMDQPFLSFHKALGSLFCIRLLGPEGIHLDFSNRIRRCILRIADFDERPRQNVKPNASMPPSGRLKELDPLVQSGDTNPDE